MKARKVRRGVVALRRMLRIDVVLWLRDVIDELVKEKTAYRGGALTCLMVVV